MKCWTCNGSGREGYVTCITCSGLGRVFLQGNGIIPVDSNTQAYIVRNRKYDDSETVKPKQPLSSYRVVVFTEHPGDGKLVELELSCQPQVGNIIRIRGSSFGDADVEVTKVFFDADFHDTLTVGRRIKPPSL